MDTIYEFTWEDKDGTHSTTVVGRDEYEDQVMYLNTLTNADLAWNATMKVIGEDI